MKIAGTKLDLPMPDGWKATKVDSKVILQGTLPDTDYHRDRACTVEFDLTDDGRLDMWHARAIVHEHRSRQKRKWVQTGVNKWQGKHEWTGKWIRCTSRRRVNNMQVVFALANGHTYL